MQTWIDLYCKEVLQCKMKEIIQIETKFVALNLNKSLA